MNNKLTLGKLFTSLLFLFLILPLNAQVVPAELILKDGDVTDGETVTSINAPFTNGDGEVGFNYLAGGVRFIWHGSSPAFRVDTVSSNTLTGGESSMGIGNNGKFIFSPSVDGDDAVWTQDGLLAVEEIQAPGFPIGTISTFHSRPAMLPDGTAYWVSGFNESGGTSSEGRILYKATPDGTISVVLRSDDLIGGIPIDRPSGIQFDFSVSDNDAHRINEVLYDVGSTTNDGALIVDDVEVARETSPNGQGDNWDNFDLMSINNNGDYVFSGDTDGSTATDEFLAVNGNIVIREGDMIGGVELTTTAFVRFLSINNIGDVVHAWRPSDGEEHVFFGHMSDLPGTSQLVISTGMEIDIDGDNVGDYTVVDLNGSTILPSADLPDSRVIFFEVDLLDVTGAEVEAIISINQGCSDDDFLTVILPPQIIACAGDEITFHPIVMGGTGDLIYQWEPAADFVDPTVANATLIVGQSGTYTLSITDENCQLFASASVDIQSNVPPAGSLACNDLVNISLDGECTALVTPDMILEGTYVCVDNFDISIDGVVGNLLTSEYAGQTLMVTVTNPSDQNNCWGQILVEDKIPPVIECPCSLDPISVSSFAGTLDGSSPIWTRPFVSSGNCSPSGTGVNVPYQTFDFFVDMVSNNSFEVITFTAPSADSYMALYTAPFDPTQPCTNLVAADDDGGSGFLSEITADLSAGIDYVLVVTTFNNNGNDFGDFEVAISGEATIMTAAPICTINCLEAEAILVGNVPIDYRPTATDACGQPSVEILNTESDLDNCEGGYLSVTWVATDESGNTATCTQVFVIEPLALEDIEFPGLYEGSCGGTTSPTETGYPTIDGQEIGEQTCNIFSAYWDTPISDCGGASKIVRTWSIVDWCAQEVREGTQVIKLYDNEGPEMTCPADMEVGTDFWYCYANVSILKPIVTDACGSGYTLSLSSTNGVIASFGGNYTISELPLGVTTVTWTAIDDCDNESTCSFTITVEDDVPPVPNCDEHTIVTLTNDAPYGNTLVSATVFDDGSYDNCSDVTFEARRMTTCIDFDWTTAGACIDDIPDGTYSRLKDGGMGFAPCVPFACCDVAQGPIMIELKVTDAAGNENFCMVEIEVQDKLAPTIECPPNIVVSCEFWFDSEVVTGQRIPLDEDPMTRVFGIVIDAYEVHDDQSARQHIVINDPGNDLESQPKDWGIDGWADDNCDVTLDVQITIEDDCSGDDLPSGAPDHAVRYIERRFTATDGQDNSDNCRQKIWVVDFDPFYIADEDCSDANRNDGVKWPCDELYTTCPDEVGVNEPVIYDDNCSLVAVTYEDTRFDFVDGACYKILREWKVIDWCQYESSTGAGLWTYTQVIKVIDSDGPEFTNCPEGPVTLCAGDEGVSLPANNQVFLGEADPDHTYCSVHLKGSLSVEEFCSDYVIYDVKVYPFNGTTYYQLVDKTQVSLDENGQAELPYDTEKSPVQAIKSDGLPYNSPFCGDYHKILWSVEDGCGNITTCEYLMRLEDCKQPTPVCVNGLSTVVMPVGGTVTIWASEYDVSSIDDCTHSDDLLFSFSGDTYQPSREWNCDNVEVFGAELSVQVWIADEGTDHNCNGQITWDERNKDYCTTTIVITDNMHNACSITMDFAIAGEVMTHAALEPVELTTISLSHPTNVFPSVVTVDDGKYEFTNVPAEGPYTVTPNRNDDHKNGVSTLDLVRIQKHLLGVEPFTSAYQYIAADANNTEGVSALDLVEIRKLILGIYIEFPNNSSWRFVDNKYAFGDVTNPWPFNESITIESLEALNLEEDFMAVKVGDLNNTVVANANNVVIRSGREEMQAAANAKAEVQSGETFEVEVTIPSEILGFQWTLDLDGLNYIGIESDQVGADNVGVHKGQITMSYARTSGDDPVTFKLIFEAIKDGRPSDMIRVTSDITETEGYVLVPAASAADNKIETVDLDLDFGILSVDEEYALYQNEPNPFIDQTIIGFDLPRAMTATLTVYKATGKVVRTIEGDFATGYNTVSLNRKDLSVGGVYYYHLTAGEFTATKKMIVTK